MCIVVTEVQLDCPLLQRGVSATDVLPQQGGRETRPPRLLQGLSSEASEGGQAGEGLPSDTCGHPEVERHGPGQERPGHPRQRGLRLEGRLPRERRSLAPARHALGGDEVHLLRLQGNGQLRQREFFKCPRFRTVRQNVKRNIVRN